MLIYDKSQNKSSDVHKLKRKSKNEFNLKNLTPGYQYGVILTLKTSQGSLISSPMYSVSPLIGSYLYKYYIIPTHILCLFVIISNVFVPLYVGDNANIKQVNTVFENGKIKISWKYGCKHDHFSTFEPDIDEPINNSLRYKVIFLCYHCNYMCIICILYDLLFITQIYGILLLIFSLLLNKICNYKVSLLYKSYKY